MIHGNHQILVEYFKQLTILELVKIRQDAKQLGDKVVLKYVEEELKRRDKI